ncbi:MAG TPA: hypothetical protein VFD69_18425 [Vicinamibacterales bacterium]|nr:hypothetical protein [Vicinamibacterales bacterium]
MAFFEWLETLFFSQWVRESGSLMAFPMFLFSHTLGMSMVAGGSTLISFAFLGLWPKGGAIKPLERLYPMMWFGFGVNAFTGIGLFCADATTRAVNLDFWIKLVFVAVGVVALVRMRKVFRNPVLDNGPVPPGAKTLAWVSLVCWFGAIVAGRLIAYVGPVAGV